jgi:hypothetical protein
MTVRISFYPSVEEGGFNRIALTLIASKVLRPSITVEAKTVADCQRAMVEAARFAADIPHAEVAALMPLSEREKAAGATHNVYVSLSWVATTRKPNGFNARRWEGYVTPVGIATPVAAE